MKNYNTIQIARLTHCSEATAGRLMQKGAFGEVNKTKKTYTIQAENREALLEIVNRETKGRHGWSRNGRSKVPPTPAYTTRDYTTVLSLLVELAQIPEDKRIVLVKLAGKFTTADLELLLTL